MLADLRSMINKQLGDIRSTKGQGVVIGSGVGGQIAVEGQTVFVLDLAWVELSKEALPEIMTYSTLE
jgi:hypothetical protein